MAGFLIVAMVFLYNERADRVGLPWYAGYWAWFDFLLYMVTTALFVYGALSSIEGLGYTLGRIELDGKVQAFAWIAIMIPKIGLYLLAVGFSYSLGYGKGLRTSERKRQTQMP